MSENIQHPTKLPSVRSLPNSYVMPGFSTANISDALEAQLQGEGSTIEQTGLYIDPTSSSRWYAVANQANYSAVHSGLQYEDIAEQMEYFHLKDIDSLDIFALGAGDGKNETMLAQHLQHKVPEMNLFLVDVSSSLLEIAYKHATTVFGPTHKDQILTVHGDMNQLGKKDYVALYAPNRPKTRRLFTMLGCTFGNLSNEIRWLRENLAGLTKNDLFLVDMALAYAPADRPDLIKKQDPRLNGKNGPGWDTAVESFFSNTLYRYCRGIKNINFIQELDSGSCVVKGSYAVSIRAHVEFHDEPDKIFTMMQYKRYDVQQLVQTLEEEGWKGSTGWEYGQNRMMYLFYKDPNRGQ